MFSSFEPWKDESVGGILHSAFPGRIKEKYAPEIKPSTLTNWIEGLKPLCRYARLTRLRSQAQELCSPQRVIKSTTLNNQQVYQYRYHQAKLDILFNKKSFIHPRFQDLKTYLTLIEKHFPHEYFLSGSGSSKAGPSYVLVFYYEI